MKFVKLLTSARVGGALRHPHEGVLHVEDDEAQRLFDDKAGEDVSADFTAKQDKAVPVESISAAEPGAEHAPLENPHQAEVAPQATEEQPTPKARKGAASKE